MDTVGPVGGWALWPPGARRRWARNGVCSSRECSADGQAPAAPPDGAVSTLGIKKKGELTSV